MFSFYRNKNVILTRTLQNLTPQRRAFSSDEKKKKNVASFVCQMIETGSRSRSRIYEFPAAFIFDTIIYRGGGCRFTHAQPTLLPTGGLVEIGSGRGSRATTAAARRTSLTSVAHDRPSVRRAPCTGPTAGWSRHTMPTTQACHGPRTARSSTPGATPGQPASVPCEHGPATQSVKRDRMKV